MNKLVCRNLYVYTCIPLTKEGIMRKFLLVKGHYNIEKIAEIGGKAHAITDEGTFKLRDNPHSNSFLLSSTLDCSIAGSVLKVLEMSQMDLKELCDSIPFSEISNIRLVSFENMIKKDALADFSKKYYLFLVGSSLAKLKYKEIVKIIMYLQTLSSPKDFALYSNNSYSVELAEWIVNTFIGSSYELGLFILLDCLENDRLDSFIAEWKSRDLYDIDLKGFLNSFVLDSLMLDRREKVKIKGYLSKLV
ncbi:uncharacterized protein VICG_00799 [Vittaforma corneae ATCC 50505]|uniref:Uncharacterized protein n=1 Tax=Vittaforma corneae (strain ATCC 50505) TaxID=993615 RepID=L2GMW1_VITCO|nr:uncharacterized protein VICG_00799 [Vittaforma corneae ATCC 50505]ELA42156.1 hypothetical protein VICG_00799 [Vittaforma corneae ATCC 50505]